MFNIEHKSIRHIAFVRVHFLLVEASGMHIIAILGADASQYIIQEFEIENIPRII